MKRQLFVRPRPSIHRLRGQDPSSTEHELRLYHKHSVAVMRPTPFGGEPDFSEWRSYPRKSKAKTWEARFIARHEYEKEWTDALLWPDIKFQEEGRDKFLDWYLSSANGLGDLLIGSQFRRHRSFSPRRKRLGNQKFNQAAEAVSGKYRRTAYLDDWRKREFIP